jgi:tRNA (cmo5U34)-methyltransferase
MMEIISIWSAKRMKWILNVVRSMSEQEKTDSTDKNIHETLDKKWEFNSDVTRTFDDMLERSIPDYENMRELCFKIGKRFIRPKETIMDLGCSRGDAIARFVNEYGWMNHYIGLEISKPMIEACRSRFSHYGPEIIEIDEYDLREGLPNKNCCLIMSVLTLQFVPINYRAMLIKQVYNRLNKGGAFIFVEKTLGETALLDEMLVDEYHALKRKNGYSTEEIERKRLALEGVLVPLTSSFNMQMLERAGFENIECFWKNLQFAGWVCVK